MRGKGRRDEARRCNLEDIAKRIGVSTSTVSRGLRGLQGVRPSLVQTIRQLASELRYEKRSSIGQKDAPTILVLSQTHNPTLDSDYMGGVSKGSLEAKATIHLHHCHADECRYLFDPLRSPHLLRNGPLDGILLFHSWPEQIVDSLRSLMPVVSLLHEYPGVDTIGIDDFSGMLQLVDHLTSNGCRRIGFFGACDAITWTRTRLAAFAGAMAVRRLALEPDHIVPLPEAHASSEKEFYFHDGMRHAQVVTEDGVDAWVCSSQIAARSLVSFFSLCNPEMPESVAVAGFHGFVDPPTRGVLTPLTTTSVAPFSLGETALRRLIQRISGLEDEPCKILLPCKLVEGKSTRPRFRSKLQPGA